MNDQTTTPPTSADAAVKPAWRDRLGAAWSALRTKASTWWRAADTDRGGIAVALVLLVCALFLLRTPGPKPTPQADAAALARRVTLLETRINALSTEPAQPAPAQDRSPDPVPARPGAPRAALRPTQPPAPAAAQTGWGTTDFDREIDDFTRSINQPEQAK